MFCILSEKLLIFIGQYFSKPFWRGRWRVGTRFPRWIQVRKLGAVVVVVVKVVEVVVDLVAAGRLGPVLVEAATRR